MGSPSVCLSRNPLGTHRKEFDAKVAEVKAMDGTAPQEAYIAAAQIMLDEAVAGRAAIVAQIKANAQRDGYTVAWGNFVHDQSNVANFPIRTTLETGEQIGDDNGQNDAGNDGARPLGAVASGENAGIEGVRGVGRSNPDGGGSGVQGNLGLDQPGLPGARSGGSGAQAVHPAGAGNSGRLGKPGTRGNGSDVSGNDARPESGAKRVRRDVTPAPTASNAPNIPAQNFRITSDVRLGQGGEVEKFNDNMLAIRTLKAIESEHRRATPTEQGILARYVGWGGLANAFPNPDPKAEPFKDAWKKRGPELLELLTPKEHMLASRSTLDSHYTSQTIVQSMWDAARRLGFKGGLALESSMGSGNFLGLIPGELSSNTKFVGVEYDSLTSRIATLLYPQATVLNSGFQHVPLSNGTFDLSIGNPPFGSQSLRFQFKPEINRHSIHNQFFLASLDAVKPGGLLVQVVSRYLLDTMDSSARVALASKARLLGAIRLPDTAFKENARTEVVTDIVFLQRLTPAEEENMTGAFAASRAKPAKNATRQDIAVHDALVAQIPDWVNSSKMADPLGGDPMQINNYFQQNPHMILGALERSGSMAFGADITVRMDKDRDLAQELSVAIGYLPRDVMAQQQNAIDASLARHQEMSDSLRIALAGHEEGSITLDSDGTLHQVMERETPEGDFELSKRALSPTSPWSANLLMSDQGKWYRVVPKLDAAGNPVKVMKGEVATNFNVYEREVFEKESDIPAGNLLGEKGYARLKDMVAIRDLLKEQLTLEAEDAPTKSIEANRKLMRDAYNKFVKENGFISESSNSSLVQNMPDGALVQALENSYRPAINAAKAAKIGEKARAASASPAPILSERVIVKYIPPTSAASSADALAIVMAESGRVDMERIAALLGKTKEDATNEMTTAEKPLIFMDPEVNELVTRDEYLSGHVKRKLTAARNAGMSQNAKELEAVQPEPWGAEGVTPLLSSTWIPPAVYEKFLSHISGGNPRVSFAALTNSFSVTNTISTTANEEAWGGEGAPSWWMIGEMLNSRAIRVLDRPDANGHRALNKELTDLALLKAAAIRAEFDDWVFADAERRSMLVSMFNEKFNTISNRQHDGSHLILPGKVPDAVIAMRRHQKNAIWRGITERFMLIDHTVGAGKTWTAVARAMERRRMGLSKKPMIVIPNHMVQQFTADAYRLYPGAKILSAGKADFEKSKRRKLFAKIATGDYDIIIMPHSSFFFIGISPETEQRYLEIELAAAEAAILDAQAAADEDGSSSGRSKPFGVKEAERLRDNITSRMDKIKGSDTKDRLLTFEQMGVDDLTVDEFHEYKNLFFSSRLTNVKGMGNKTGSQKAFDMYNKIRVLRDSPKGTVTLMTGTPISNSAVEMYSMMRYLAADQLKELGLDHFDAWRSQFVSTDAGWEPNETGRLKEVNRLGRTWSNMRSLMNLYYSFTDSVSNDDIKKSFAEDNPGKEFPIPRVMGGDRQSVVVQPTEAQVTLLTEIIDDFDNLPNIQDPRERNIKRLKLMDRARKVSLDVRAADPASKSDEKGGKLEKIAGEVHRIYKKWDVDRGTQLIFLDRSVPKAKGDTKVLKEYDALLAAQSKALAYNDEEGLRRVGESLERFDPNAMEEMRTAQTGGWNAYQQIKDNLIALGVPANEIRFMQEANNDAQKQAMFDAVNDGTVRVLIGSTPRMGAGTNVQKRLVALHHADVTWKPSDIEQREGRIIRQGNDLLEKYGMNNFEVEILAYAAERTIDAKMWSLNSSKLKTINGIRKYDGAFSMEFEDEESVSMAELAALASGDPLLLERVKLMSEIDKLNLLSRQHKRKEFGVLGQIEDAQHSIARLPVSIADGKAELKELRAALAIQSDKVAERNIEIEGTVYHTANAAKQAAYASQQRQQGDDEKAKFSIAINGRRKASQTGYMEEIAAVFGDSSDFEVTMDDEPYIQRTDAARRMSEKAAAASLDLKKGENKSVIVGSYLGMPLEATYARSTYMESYTTLLALLRPDGSTFATGETNQLQFYSTAGMRTAFTQLDAGLDLDNKAGNIRYAEERLERAKAELPGLEAKKGGAFAGAADLAAKSERLEEVIRELALPKEQRANYVAPAVVPITTSQDTDGSAQSPVLFSRQAPGADANVQTGANGQRAAISHVVADQVLGRIVAGFNNRLAGIRFSIVDSFNQLPPSVIKLAIRDKAENAIHGANVDNTIYLIRDKHATEEAFEKTILHELYGHEGLHRLFGPQMVSSMNNLYQAIGGKDGMQAIVNRHKIDLSQYAIAVAQDETLSDEQRISVMMDEMLAHIAEDKPTLRMKLKGFIGMLRNWLRTHGFPNLAHGTDADLYYLLKRAKNALGGPGGNGGGIAFSRGVNENTQAGSDILKQISQIGDAFKYKTSASTTVEGIAADVRPDINVRKITTIPGETRYQFDLPDGSMGRMVVRPFNKYGPSLYGFDLNEGEMVDRDTDRPGKNADEAHGKDDVFIDVSLLEPGSGLGSAVYNIAANYAHNTGKIFIGDPAGITDEALMRRPEQMLSSALKFGTTEHLAPHPHQISGKPSAGIAPLDWVYGDHVGNIQKLIDVNLQNIDNHGGNGDIQYDASTGRFTDAAGTSLTRADILGLAETGLGRAAQAGGNTLARYALLRSSLQPLQSGQSGRDSIGVLESLGRQLRNHVSTVAQGSGELKGIFYKRAGGVSAALAQAGNNLKDVRLPADYLVGDLFNQSGKISWWHKTIGTQYSLAKSNPLFARVYDRIQNFIGDVSQFAVEAADLAPNILPKLEHMSDMWKKQPLTPADTKAISAPIFEGTLVWSRGVDGKPIKLIDLEDAASRLSIAQKAQVLLRKGVIDDEQNKRWMENPLDFYDAAITNRFEQSELQGGIVWTPEELRAMFGLNDKQIGLYQEFRAATDRSLTNLAISDMVKFGGKDAKDMHQAALATGDVVQASALLRDHFMALAESDPDKAKAHLDTADQMISKSDRAKQLMDRGYAPLSRYGHYTVYVEDAGEQVYFGMFEDKIEASKMARKMRDQYPGAKVTHGTTSMEAYKLFSGVSPETVELFGSMLGLDQNDATGNEAYQAYLKLAKNNRSAMKRLIQRKGIAGFSEDAGRVLAGFVYSNARLTAANVHMGELNDSINEIPNAQGELKDAAVQLAEHVKNPSAGSSGLGGLMFAQYLGGSVASAMVNLTQPFTMTFPYLSQYGGIGKAAARMTAAVRDAGKDSTGDAALDAALKHASEEGIVSPQEVHYIQSQAAGKGVLQSGDGTKLGDARAKASNTMAKLALGWGKLFSLAELTNRRITFIAAYRTAIEQGIANPAQFAADTIAATQGTYNAGNRPRWARSTLGGLAFTFKQYSIAYVELLGRMAFAGEPGSKERAEGRKAALLMLAVLMLMSGADGLPFEADIEDVIDGILQRMGYNFSTKRKKQEFLTEVLGAGGADFALKGLSGLPGIPIDVAGRFGMGNLIPATGLFTKKESYARDIGELAGPAGDFATRTFGAAGKVMAGDLLDAVGDVSPVAVRNIEKGADMLKHDAYRDTRGYKVNDSSATEAVLKMVGFQPNSTAHIQDAKGQALNMINQTRMYSKQIAEHWAQGLANGDNDMVAQARRMRDDWNARNPETRITVNMPGVIKRVREMKRSAIERTQNTAPKALKDAVKRELSEV